MSGIMTANLEYTMYITTSLYGHSSSMCIAAFFPPRKTHSHGCGCQIICLHATV